MTAHLDTIDHGTDFEQAGLAGLGPQGCPVFELEDAMDNMTLTEGVMELLAAFGEFADCDSRAA